MAMTMTITTTTMLGQLATALCRAVTLRAALPHTAPSPNRRRPARAPQPPPPAAEPSLDRPSEPGPPPPPPRPPPRPRPLHRRHRPQRPPTRLGRTGARIALVVPTARFRSALQTLPSPRAGTLAAEAPAAWRDAHQAALPRQLIAQLVGPACAAGRQDSACGAVEDEASRARTRTTVALLQLIAMVRRRRQRQQQKWKRLAERLLAAPSDLAVDQGRPIRPTRRVTKPLRRLASGLGGLTPAAWGGTPRCRAGPLLPLRSLRLSQLM